MSHNVLIETSSGKVLAVGENVDFQSIGMFDNSKHVIRTDGNPDLKPFNPNHDEQYHSWNGSQYNLVSVTDHDFKHCKSVEGIVIKASDGKDYSVDVIDGKFVPILIDEHIED